MLNYSLHRVGPLILFGYTENDSLPQLLYNAAYYTVNYGPYYELLASAICFIANAYSAFRFTHVGTYSRNFRVVMISMNLFVTGIAILRPICYFVPEDYYLIEDKKYISAFIMYSIGYILHICIFIFDSKYILIAFERQIAFKLRATYENTQDNTTIKAFLLFLCVVWLGVTTKAVFVIFFREHDVDVALQKAFMMDSSFYTLMAAHVVALASWFYGCYVFNNLSKRAKHIRRYGTTLTEAFIIKEVVNVIQVISPIINAYICIMVVAVIILAYMIPSYMLGVMVEEDVHYHGLVTFEYMLIDTYNLYASCYMIWHFKNLRRALFEDITRCLRRKCVTEVEPEPLECYNRTQEAEIYFTNLKDMWNT